MASNSPAAHSSGRKVSGKCSEKASRAAPKNACSGVRTSVCTCDESGCAVRIKRVPTFELVLDENQLTGQFAELGDGFLTGQ